MGQRRTYEKDRFVLRRGLLAPDIVARFSDRSETSCWVYFDCADCATEAARVVKAGGRIQREKFSIGEYGLIALAIDTEGNMFGLHAMQ
jgi:predicted enzyme related to lactoylglutathione lyase